MWAKRRLGYLLLLAAMIAISLLIAHDFFVAVMLIALMAGQPIYLALKKFGRMVWLIPYGLLFAVGLGCLYYGGNLLVFPHSPHASHHVRDAAVTGIGAAICGFFGTWIKECKGLPMHNDPLMKTQEKS